MENVGKLLKQTMILCSVVLAIGIGVASGATAPVIVDRVVAVVNDEVITMSDLQREMQKRKDITDQKLVLEEMIDRKLQMDAAKRNGMAVTDKELTEAVNDIMARNKMDAKQFEAALVREGLTPEQYRTEFREQMTMSRLFNKFVRSGVSVDNTEIRTYYDKNTTLYSLPEEVKVRHLVVPVKEQASPSEVAAAREQAESLMARIRTGEDFIRLIREYSGSPTAARDGDLGFLPRGTAIPEIEEATKDLKPGEYAGPVRVGDGFHIIRVEEIRRPVMPFEKVKDEIQKLLFEQKLENTYRTFLQTLRSDAHIENRL
jgi:peptidyl-prolyl cis-trans isomerase SurA